MIIFKHPRSEKCGLDWKNGRRAFVLTKHRASGGTLSRAFDVGEIGPFAERLKAAFPDSRYAIRDWLAGSMLDFFETRYDWTEEDFLKHRPENLLDPFETEGPSAVPPKLCDYRTWLPSNRENETRILGHKSGQSFDQKLYEKASAEYVELKNFEFGANAKLVGVDANNEVQVTAYLAQREKHGFRIYRTAEDIPDRLCVVTARLRLEVRWTLLHLFKNFAEPNQIFVPCEEREMLAALKGRYVPESGGIINDPKKLFFYEGKNEKGKWRLFLVGHHKLMDRGVRASFSARSFSALCSPSRGRNHRAPPFASRSRLPQRALPFQS